MSPMLIKFVNAIITNIFVILIVKKVTKSSVKLKSLKNLIWLFISTIPSFIFTTADYGIINNILWFFFLVLMIKNVFYIDIITTSVLTLYIMIITVLPDLLVSAIMINFIDFNALRTNFIVILFTSIIIYIITYFIFCIPIIKKFTQYSISHVQKSKNKKILIFIMLIFLSIGISYFTTASLFKPTKSYFMANIVILIFIFIMLMYLNEIIKYDKLQLQNDILCECMQNVEEYQEQQDLKIHEYKNQLSKISFATKDKKVIKLLEEILQIDLTTDNYILGQLKYIPKGDIKSLIYYKLLVASKQQINIILDISPKIKHSTFEFSSKINKELSQLIGIYFDNAIEASSSSKKKTISLEVYILKGNLVFVIMNTYKDKVNIEKMTKKGFSTKGGNHGKGLYFAKKIIENSKQFDSESKFIGDYYMQKIIIKKD